MNRKLPPIYYILPVLLIAFTSVVLFTIDKSGTTANREAVAGRLELADADFAATEGIRLNGQWEFYPEQLLVPERLLAPDAPEPGYLAVPGSWKGQVVHGEELTSKGYGTYRLIVALPETSAQLALKTNSISTAHKMWINGKLAAQSGAPGTYRAEARPLMLPKVTVLEPGARQLEIVIQVSNFTQRKAGLFAPVVLGQYEALKHLANRQLAIESLLIGSMLIMGLYHIALFIMLRKKTDSLLFGFICLLLAVKNSTHGQVFMSLFFEQITDYVLVKTEYFSFVGSTPLFVLFIYTSFPGLMPRRLCNMLWIPGALFTLFILVTPVEVFTSQATLLQLYAVITACVLIQYIFKAAILKLQGGTLMATGGIVFFITVVNDIMMSNGVIHTGVYFPYGLLFLIVCLSIILSLKFSTAFKTVEQLSDRLLELDKVKDQFLANTSHELRTPLNGMIGLAQSLLQQQKGKLKDREELHLNMIISSGQRMSFLINDILDYSRLLNNDIRLQTTRINLYELIHLVLTIVEPLTSGRRLTIINKVEPGFPPFFADENRLQQIVFNLVGNAIKYTPEGEIAINAVHKGYYVEIEVADTGIGIPRDKFAAIFEPFEQLDQHTEVGSGLGLKITKQLVELHGGMITVQSEVGAGSRFRFSIYSQAAGQDQPLPPQQQANQGEFLPATSSGTDTSYLDERSAEEEMIFLLPREEAQPRRLLVVDDDPVNMQVVIQQLAALNCIVDSAIRADSVAQRLDSLHQYDLVIADLMMPGMSGYELCVLIREHYTMQELPILIMTASNRGDTIAACFRAGANDYVSKPFERNELISRAHTLLIMKRAVQETSLHAQRLARLNTELQDLNTNLEERIQERTVELEQMNRDLEHKNNALSRLELVRKRLLSDVSHELRTPMTAIQGYVEAIVKGLVDDEQVKTRYLEMVLSKAIGLNRLIQDLFELSRLESRRSEMVFEITPLFRLIGQIKDRFMLDAVQAGLEYRFSFTFAVELLDEYQVVIDSDRIMQVLTNLVFNAIHHTPAGGRITITCDVGSDSGHGGQRGEAIGGDGNGVGVGDRVGGDAVEGNAVAGGVMAGNVGGSDAADEYLIIHVTDTGSGIRPESLPYVFNRFFREYKEPGGASSYRGSGIGLAIAKEIVQYHDGTITVHSMPGEGSTFSFTLPLGRYE